MRAENNAMSSGASVVPAVSADELAELQSVCARIAADGGELGALAVRIARLSQDMSRLSAFVDKALAL